MMNDYLNVIIENTTDVVWVVDAHSEKYMFVAGALYETLGFTPEDYTLLTLKQTVNLETYLAIKKTIIGLLKDGLKNRVKEPKTTMEIQKLHKNGSLVWVEFSFKIIKDNSNAFNRIVGTTRLIEDRKRLELDLIESESKHRFISDNMNDIVWVVDITTQKYLYVGGAVKKVTGYTVNEYLNKVLADTLPPHSYVIAMDLIKTEVDRYLSGDAIDNPEIFFDIEVNHKNGTLIWIEVSSRIVLNEKNNSLEIVGQSRVVEGRKRLELELKESKDKYSLITENMNDMVCGLDLMATNFTFVIGASLSVFGYTNEEYLRIPVMESMPFDSYIHVTETIASEVGKFMKGEVDYPQATLEIQQYHKDGSLVWVEISARAIINDKKEITEIVAITRRIDKRKELEAELKAKEEKYRLVVENQKDYIYVIDLATGKFVFIDGGVYDINGWTPEEYMQLSMNDTCNPESIQLIYDNVQRVIEETKSGKISVPAYTIEIQGRHKNGHWIWLEVSSKLIKNNSDDYNQIIGVARLIDDRKKLELELKEKEEKYRLMAENVNDLFWIIDVNTFKLIHATGPFEDILGYTPEEFIELPLESVMLPEHLQNLFKILEATKKEYLETNVIKGVVVEIQNYHKNGSLVWIELSVKMFLDDKGNMKLVGTSRLIEERKKLELELKEKEEKYRLVTEHQNDYIWIIDLNTLKFEFVTGAYNKLLGFTFEELLSMTLPESTTPETMERLGGIIGSLVEKGYAGDLDVLESIGEIPLYHKNGTLLPFEYSARIIKNNSNEFNQIVGASRLIEDRKKLEAELKASEEKYRMMTENMQDTIYLMDLKTEKHLFVGGNNLLDYEKPLSLGEIVSPETYKYVKDLYSRLIKEYNAGKIEEPLATIELQAKKADGSFVWLEDSFKIIKNNSTEFNQVIGVSRSIEDRKKLESKLKASEEKYRLMAENMQDVLWIIDIETLAYTFISDSSEEITGYTLDGRNHTLADEFPLESLAIIKNIIETELKKYYSGELIGLPKATFELQQYHKDGYLIWIEISAKALPSTREDGILTQIIGTTRRIDDRKKLEADLKANEEKYRLMAENMKDTLWIIDINTLKYLYKSDASTDMTGYTPEESENKSLSEVFPPKSMDFIRNIIGLEFKKYYEGKLEALPEATFELEQYHKDGSLVWVEISATALPSTREDGILTQIIGTTRRIDDRKLAEAKIVEQKEELEHQKMELMHQKEELEKLNATKDKFFSIIAHDLRNPFSSLLNMSEMLNEDYDELPADKIKQGIAMINNSSEHIYKLLENLLEWAHSSTGEMTCNPMENNINEIISECVNNLQSNANAKNIKIKHPDMLTPNYVLCDMNMIHTVLRNLISNAIKFSFNDSNIEIAVADYAKDNNYICISIKDKGVGIKAEDINKLFKIDSKMTTKGTAQEKGTGLGLIICKEFVDRHNCKIWVESKINKGTTFHFTLPKMKQM